MVTSLLYLASFFFFFCYVYFVFHLVWHFTVFLIFCYLLCLFINLFIVRLLVLLLASFFFLSYVVKKHVLHIQLRCFYNLFFHPFFGSCSVKEKTLSSCKENKLPWRTRRSGTTEKLPDLKIWRKRWNLNLKKTCHIIFFSQTASRLHKTNVV